jgi:hypothetical protein
MSAAQMKPEPWLQWLGICLAVILILGFTFYRYGLYGPDPRKGVWALVGAVVVIVLKLLIGGLIGSTDFKIMQQSYELCLIALAGAIPGVTAQVALEAWQLGMVWVGWTTIAIFSTVVTALPLRAGAQDPQYEPSVWLKAFAIFIGFANLMLYVFLIIEKSH